MKNNFLRSSAILFSGEFITRFLGFIYISPLYTINPYVANVNAALMPAYIVVLLVAMLGVGSSMTQKFSRYLDDPKRISQSFYDGIMFALISGVAMTLIMMLFPDFLISDTYNTDPNYPHLINGMYILALSILPAVINVLLYSYLVAKNHLKMRSLTLVSEQVIKIAIVFIAALYYFSYNTSPDYYMIYAFTISITLSVISTTIFTTYYMYKNGLFKELDLKNCNFRIKRIVVVVASGFLFFVNTFFISGFTFIDNNMFPWLTPLNQQDAASINVIYTGNVMKLIGLPITLSTVFTTLMVRQITITRESRKFKSFDNILNLILYYSMFCFVFFTSSGLVFYLIFWKNADPIGIPITAVTALIIPFFIIRLAVSLYALLRKQIKQIIISSVILFTTKIILNILFVPFFSVYGFTIASCISIGVSLVYLILSSKSIFNFSIRNLLRKTLLIIKFVIVGIVMYFLTSYLENNLNVGNVLLFIIVSIILLVITILLFGRNIIKLYKYRGNV